MRCAVVGGGIIGLAVAWRLARRWTSSRPQARAPDPSPEERRTLAAELAQLRRQA